MAISTTDNRKSFGGDGIVTAFYFPYSFFASSDLVVIQKVTATGVETLKAITTDYTVAGGNGASGTVTMLVAPPTGTVLTILNDPAITQGLDLVENDSLPAESVERAFDRLTLISQRTRDLTDRTVRLTDGYSAAFNPELPEIITPDTSLIFNPTGTGFAIGPVASDIAGAQAQAIAAAASAAAAVVSAATASTQAGNSSTSATASAASATTASTQAGIATTQAGISTTQAGISTTQAGISTTQATASGVSAAAAVVSAATASTQAGNSSTSATASAASATTASTQAGISTTQAAAAAVSAADAAAVALSVDTRRNFLINGNFDFWQRSVSSTVANGSSAYVADRWYAANLLGTNGVLTFSRAAGVSAGAKYGCSLQITTAPTAAQANGCFLLQTLENRDSLLLYNQTASFTAKIKALGLVTQVGVQFYYSTTEIKAGNAIGSEILVTVNSSTFSTVSIAGQALGTAMTVNGTIGVQIRITAVSGGNTWAVNGGFVVEQASVNVGTTPPTRFARAGDTMAQELVNCQRYYEKSFDTEVPPTSITTGMIGFTPSATTSYRLTVGYKVTKRSVPTPTIYSLDATPTIGSCRDLTAGANRVTTASDLGNGSFICSFAALVSGNICGFQWSADAEI